MARPDDAVEAGVGHRFSDSALLDEALTHSSYAGEHPGASSYERLEFLGDAVLELVTTQVIFDAMPEAPEGTMTRVRAAVVDEATLADVARRWHLGPALRLGIGEERAGGAERDSILSDAAEAVIAAIYLDAGFERAHALIAEVWRPIVAERIDRETVIDSRSELQELLAKRGTQVSFTYHRDGPDHAVVFTASAIVDGDVVGRGTGGSKKAAAIAAARDALQAEGV